MACHGYEIGIRDAAGRTMTRTWSEAEVMKSVNWLKRENAKGADILIQPVEKPCAGLVLLAGLRAEGVAALGEQGCEPVAVIETAPQQYQAWVRVSAAPLAAEVAALVGRELVKRFGAEVATGERGFGRLAGFTNRDPDYADAQGRNPWVLCHRATAGDPPVVAATLVTWAAGVVTQQAAEWERDARLEAAEAAVEGVNGLGPVYAYQQQLKRLKGLYGADLDVSRADYAICVALAQQGCRSAQLEQALTDASPAVPSCEANGERDYAERTVQAAFRDPAVRAILAARSRSLERSKPWGHDGPEMGR